MRSPLTWLCGTCLAASLLAPVPVAGQGAQPTDDAALTRIASALRKLGYSGDPRTSGVFLQSAMSRGPTFVPGLGSDGGRLILGKARECNDSLRAAVPACVRFDGIEAYAGRPDSLRGLVPFTLAGSAGQPLPEVAVSQEVLADAARVAEALKVRLFRPPPLPALPVTPDD